MNTDELGAWLRLSLTHGVGRVTARKLLMRFGHPQAVFDQTPQVLSEVATSAQVRALGTLPEQLAPLLEKTTHWLQGATPQTERLVLHLGDAAYPASLLLTEDPPLMLYVVAARGFWANPAAPLATNTELAGADSTLAITCERPRAVAIVGSRNATPQGLNHARAFAKALVDAGLSVVSGLALGIDGAAHEGALASAGIFKPGHPAPGTVAVVGTGLDRVYPKQHLDLAHRITQHGALISEFHLGTPPIDTNFPARNRIISGLTRGTLVVEAALRSGSLITARMANEQGKDIYAIPGSIQSPQSKGCHALIKQGAKLVESADDVLSEMGFEPVGDGEPARLPLAERRVASRARAPGATSLYAKQGNDHDALGSTRRPNIESASAAPANNSVKGALLAALGFEPCGLDALCDRTGLDAGSLQAHLLELELEGHVARMHGGLFQRVGLA